MKNNGKHLNKSEHTLKYYVVLILVCYIAFVVVDFSVHTTNAKEITQGISEKIIRLHVLANSDADYDQALKLKVKDAIVEELTKTFVNVKSKEEARILIRKNYAKIRNIARSVINEEGYDYDVHVYLGDCMFPTKIYKDLTFPAGEYEALRVDIGNAEGKNWWCVMYPPLCFVDQTYSVVPEDSKRQLKDLLTTKEYESLFADKDTKITYRFKIIEIFKHIIDTVK